MNFMRLVPVAVLAFHASLASAQFVKGNEAVRTLPDGRKRVELPPHSAGSSARRICAAEAGCHAGPWFMVETTEGLRECTETLARPTTCRESTYGSERKSRVWVAKRGSTWLWCQYPDLDKKCVDMHAKPPLNLPFSAIQ